MLFENMGITYLGPVDGHDIGKLQDILNKAKKVKGAVLVRCTDQEGEWLCTGRAPSSQISRRRAV